jgi:hypothetical protein
MSERDRRYATSWEPVWVFLALVVMLSITIVVLRGEIRDLQRRVGQLEQRLK